MKITIGTLVSLQQKQIPPSGVTFGVPALPDVLEQLHSIRPSTSLLRVPKDHPLRFDVFLDQSGNGRAEGFLLVRTDPNEEPAEEVSGFVSITGHELTSLDSECRWTRPLQYLYLCRSECRDCT